LRSWSRDAPLEKCGTRYKAIVQGIGQAVGCSRQSPIVLSDHLFHVLSDRQTTSQTRRIEAAERNQARPLVWTVADVEICKGAPRRRKIWSNARIVWSEQIWIDVRQLRVTRHASAFSVCGATRRLYSRSPGSLVTSPLSAGQTA
jgi:hypothetical protein